jgi:Flp pilus assembly protein TadD
MWRLAAALGAVAVIGTATPVVTHAAETEEKPADPDHAAGKEALDRKDWSEALQRFRQAALRDPDSADLQNYLGYAHRKLGQMEPAFAHYRKALELNPRHRGAHEYVGEAYLMVGDLASAEKHLAALREICLLGCSELEDLEREVAAYRERTGATRSR